MNNDTARKKIPSTREEILKIIFRNFVTSNFNTITLALYPYEVTQFKEQYKEIVICKKEGYQPESVLSIFIVSKRPQN